MKVRNYYIYGTEEYLRNLQEEYNWLGRDTRLEQERLVVLGLTPKPTPPKKKFNRRPQRKAD